MVAVSKALIVYFVQWWLACYIEPNLLAVYGMVEVTWHSLVRFNLEAERRPWCATNLPCAYNTQ